MRSYLSLSRGEAWLLLGKYLIVVAAGSRGSEAWEFPFFHLGRETVGARRYPVRGALGIRKPAS